MIIRDAVDTDIPTITEIYNHAVTTGIAIWHYDRASEHNRLAWLNTHRDEGFPVLVAAEGGTVYGYATYGTWRTFEGFTHTVENSIYVHEGAQGRGVGKQLLAELINRARAQKLHVMVAAIESSNEASIALHAKFGFDEVGHMPQVGCKFGRWLDLTFMQLLIDDRVTP